MSLPMALEEQLSIDQPPGIVSRFSALLSRFGETPPPERTSPARYGLHIDRRMMIPPVTERSCHETRARRPRRQPTLQHARPRRRHGDPGGEAGHEGPALRL